MPVDHDIKDAGILAGFERWGWPWHGLCEGGVIGSSGKTIPQPLWGNAWLIDKGLPEVDITPAEIVSEALAGREWRNYALIAGGQVNGTWLPRRLVFGYYESNAYIHIDADGIPWMVTLSATFPGSNVTRISLAIVRFGHFELGVGEQAAITKTIDVTCEAVELTNPLGGPFAYRDIVLHDVWTNGAKALTCVWMKTDLTYDYREVFSCIEIEITGSGGADGSLLSVGASEVKGQGVLSSIVDNAGTSVSVMSGSYVEGYNFVPDGMGCYIWGSGSPMEVKWEGLQGFVNGYPLTVGYLYERTSCRFCCYGSDGGVIAYRLRSSIEIDNWVTGFSDTGKLGDKTCIPGGPCNLGREISVSVAGHRLEGYYLLQNDAVIDRIEHETNYVGTQAQGRGTYASNPCDLNQYWVTYPDPYHETGKSWNGSLSASIPTAASWPYSGGYPAYNMFPAWRIGSETSSGGIVTLDDGITKLGIFRSMNVAGFFMLDSVREYGIIATPLGNKATSETGALYFAWQRKTGDFAFSANPICYV